MPGRRPRDELPTSPTEWAPEQLRHAAAQLKDRAYELLHMAWDLEAIARAAEGGGPPALPPSADAGDKSNGGEE